MMEKTPSFLAGYDYGMKCGSRELTTTEILDRWPAVDVEAFAQGMIDGLLRDDFRARKYMVF